MRQVSLCSRTMCNGTYIFGFPDSVNFGQQLAFRGDVLVIGAAHHAYMYRLGTGGAHLELEVPNIMYSNGMISPRAFASAMLSSARMVVLPTTMLPIPGQHRLAFGPSDLGKVAHPHPSN